MSPVTNGRLIFAAYPEGYPEPGKTTVYDESEKVDLDNVPSGGYIVKTLYLSADPYMRGRMRRPEISSYSAPFKLGEPIEGLGIGVVIKSDSPDVKVGDHVYGSFKYQQYTVHPNFKDSGRRVIKNEEGIPWSDYIGVAGMPGETAYMAWKEYAKPKEGDVVFVSGGAGAVGSLVVQLAKLDGLKVIASAGSDEKVAFIKSLGADYAFNYKTTKTADALKEHGPIDIYWDNVGGETLEAALDAARTGARFIECGMISGYNTTPYPIKNLFLVIGKSISMHGFIVSVLRPKYEAEFQKTLPALVASGKIKARDHVFEGLQQGGEALLSVQKGTNLGKAVIHVGDE